MTQTTKVFVGMLVIAAVLVIGFFTVGPAGEKVFASPQEAFEASRKASLSGNLANWCQCLTDDSRDYFVAVNAFEIFVQRMRFEKAVEADAKSPFRAVDDAFAKHGLTPQFMARVAKEANILKDPRASTEEKVAFAKAMLDPVRNPNLFIADVFKAMSKFTNSDLPEIVDVWKDTELSDLKVTGNTAVGTLSVGDRPGGPIFFRKQGEGWRIDVKDEEKKGRLPMGHPPMR